MMLSASALEFSFHRSQPVLRGIDLKVEQGEIVALLGPSGCGKTTLLRILADLLPLQGGEIQRKAKSDFALVFQEPSLMPWCTVEDNVALPLKLAGKDNSLLVRRALDEVGLQDFSARKPSELSGGQKMRVSIARALVSEPALLFLDEPFAALDEILRFKMNDLLLKLRSVHQLACVFVTHSVYEASYLADRILVMQGGKVSGAIVPSLDRSLKPAQQRASEAFHAAVGQVSALLEGPSA